MINWSQEEFEEYTKNRKVNEKENIEISLKSKSKSKYKNEITEIDGNKFSSKAEAEYYLILKDKLKKNEIDGFCLQPKFILQGYVKYKADFIIFYKDRAEVIEIKGYETDLWKAKNNLFKEKFPNLIFKIIRR